MSDARTERMRLWLVSRDEFEYDEYDAFVIRAASEEDAQRLAHERERTWGEVRRYDRMQHTVTVERDTSVKCIEIAVEGDEEIILASFNKG